MRKLTKKESLIMDIFWSQAMPLTAREITDHTPGMSVYSVQQVLARLLDDDIIRVSGITHNKNAIARQYVPQIHEADYLISIINNEDTPLRFTENYVDKSEDIRQLEDLKRRIIARVRTLQEKQ